MLIDESKGKSSHSTGVTETVKCSFVFRCAKPRTDFMKCSENFIQNQIGVKIKQYLFYEAKPYLDFAFLGLDWAWRLVACRFTADDTFTQSHTKSIIDVQF